MIWMISSPKKELLVAARSFHASSSCFVTSAFSSQGIARCKISSAGPALSCHLQLQQADSTGARINNRYFGFSRSLHYQQPKRGKSQPQSRSKQTPKRLRINLFSNSDSYLQQQEQEPAPEGKFRKKSYDLTNKKKESKKGKAQLYRADRVLANRSGRTRSECFKLLTRHAISIVEETNETPGTNSSSESRIMDEDISQLMFRKLRGPKERIPMNARLFIHEKFEVPSLPPLLTVYHKPKWVLSTMGEDSRGRNNLQHLDFPHANQMHPVGRLDYDTSGLLLFSSSGALTQTLLHPKYEKEKEYMAVVTGLVNQKELQEKLLEGVQLVDVSRSAKREQELEASSSSDAHTEKRTFITRATINQVEHVPTSDVQPYLQDIRANLPSEYNQTDLNLRGYMDVFDAQELSRIKLVVQEGKHRMVRRMLASCGHTVVSLQRVRMGMITLGDLKEGSFRNMTEDEEAWTKSLVVDS